MTRYNVNKLMETADLFGDLKNGDTPKGFDSLFGISSSENINTSGLKQLDIPLENLKPYKGHKFKKPTGEDWESFVESIKNHGVLQPIIVHEMIPGQYEIIAGHCRTEGAKEAGHDKIPAIVMDIDDDIAISVLVGLTNKQRVHISDIEWGETYKVTYDMIKAQGKDKGGKRADELLSEMYGESARTIQRKMRLTFLIPEIADLYESGKIKQAIAVDLSYISEDKQTLIYTLIDSGKKVSEEMTKEIKEIYISQGDIDEEQIRYIIGEAGKIENEGLKKEIKKVGIKVNKKVKKKYFPESYDDSDIDNIIEQLLAIWAKENNPDYIEGDG